MIKNIGNSFLGGFFRRLGSLFALFFILTLIGYLLKDLDTNSLVNKLLGIQKVSALEVEGVRQRNIDFFGASDSNLKHNIDTCGTPGVVNYDITAVTPFTATNNEKFAVIYFNKTIIQRHNSTAGGSVETFQDSYMTPFFALKSNGAWSYCEIHDNFIICPLSSGVTYNGLRIRYQRYSVNSTCYSWQDWRFDIDRYVPTYNSASSLDVINAVNQVQDQQQQTNNKLDETNNQLQQTNDTLNSTDTTEADSEASELFTNTEYETHGITGIITAPLNLIESLLSKTCSPLELPLPFVSENLILPCMLSIYQQNFPTFLTIYQIVISALIGYRICVSVFFMVKDFKNPDSDKIEVLDL